MYDAAAAAAAVVVVLVAVAVGVGVVGRRIVCTNMRTKLVDDPQVHHSAANRQDRGRKGQRPGNPATGGMIHTWRVSLVCWHEQSLFIIWISQQLTQTYTSTHHSVGVGEKEIIRSSRVAAYVSNICVVGGASHTLRKL
jgi:hypothetical protein